MTQIPADEPWHGAPAPVPAANLPEYSVGELSRALKRTVEEAFSYVRVRGEISGFKRAASGHLYMALKDVEAVLDAVCWRGQAERLGLVPEDGLEVVCSGRITTYMGRSKYQLIIETMELAGEGALLKLLEERKRKLAAEGLFDEALKRPLPFLPAVIGIVTSPTGAVIRDILHRLADRFPRHVLIWPVLVQGEGAAAQIAAAIEGFNRIARGAAVPRPDLIIVARGGGSLEDLWAFNEEVVVRAAAASRIPLISAVGHETDTTLIDYAADRRAPTPSAAAEIAVPVRAELVSQVADAARRLMGGAFRFVEARRDRLAGLARGLPEPRRLLEEAAQRLDDRAERLDNAKAVYFERRRSALALMGQRLVPGLRHVVAERRTAFALLSGRLQDRTIRRDIADGGRRLVDAGRRLAGAMARTLAEAERRLGHCAGLLESYSYQRVLERGFALVRDAAERPVTSVAQARPGLPVSLQFHDGAAPAVIGGASGSVKAPRKAKAGKGNDRQGRLL
jgi:exodeoxyribonuclease VII large subunit